MMANATSDFDNGYLSLNVEHVTKDFGLDEYVSLQKEITKNHWKPVPASGKCTNVTCRKPFSVFERYHHCRKCGDVFCNNCTLYKRRLNRLAHFDPAGQPYKVCKVCFDTGALTEGQSQSHTTDFIRLRAGCVRSNGNNNNNSRNIPLSPTSSARRDSSVWKLKIDFEKECGRLLNGFGASYDQSEIVKQLNDFMGSMMTPEWMKSSIWLLENMVTKCRLCSEVYTLMNNKKRFCSICGISICKTCSTRDLLLYVPDGVKGGKGNAKMAIIRFVGCPELEPEVSLLVRVCPQCREQIIAQQVQADEPDQLDSVLDLSSDFMTTLDAILKKFRQSEIQVHKQLPNYTHIVESLEDGSRGLADGTVKKSNMKTLAKAQEDLADAIATHATLTYQLKKLSPSTPTQTLLHKNCIRAKCQFYLDKMSAFRSVKSKLSNAASAESLDFIQRIMDKNAIISTHLVLRQLVYEILNLTQQYKFDDKLPSFLITVEQQIESEVKQCLINDKENVEEHMNVVIEMTRLSIQDRPLIKLKMYVRKSRNKTDLYDFVLSRTDDILNQLKNQLELTSANRRFQSGKRCLNEALSGLKECGMKESNNKNGFIMFSTKKS